MKGYKGFNKGLICRGKQYAENTVFEEEKANVCESGMHFCDNPIDVLDYYGFVNDNGELNEFAEVESLGETLHRENKYCTTKLKVGAKFSFAGFVKACVDFILEKTSIENEEVKEGNNEDSARIGSSGDSARIGSSGDSARIGSSGDYARIGSSGDSARIGSSGYSARIGSSGDSARIGSSGDYARIGSSGYSAQIGSSGDSAKIGSSGDYARIGSSGDSARIGSSGYSARIGSSGYSAQIGSSGDYARIESTGEDSVICCAGHGSAVKAKKGSWITLSEWGYDEIKGRYVPVCVKTERVDGEKIKEDTFYKLENGEFIEIN